MKTTITIEDTHNGEHCQVAINCDPDLDQVLDASLAGTKRSSAAIMTVMVLDFIAQLHDEHTAATLN